MDKTRIRPPLSTWHPLALHCMRLTLTFQLMTSEFRAWGSHDWNLRPVVLAKSSVPEPWGLVLADMAQNYIEQTLKIGRKGKH